MLFFFDLLPQYKLLEWTTFIMLSAWWNLQEYHLISNSFPSVSQRYHILSLMSFSWHIVVGVFSPDVHLPFKCIVNIPLIHIKTTRAMRGAFTWIKWWLNRLNGLPEESHHFDSNPNNFYSTYALIQLSSSLVTHSELVAWLVISLEPRLS